MDRGIQCTPWLGGRDSNRWRGTRTHRLPFGTSSLTPYSGLLHPKTSPGCCDLCANRCYCRQRPPLGLYHLGMSDTSVLRSQAKMNPCRYRLEEWWAGSWIIQRLRPSPFVPLFFSVPRLPPLLLLVHVPSAVQFCSSSRSVAVAYSLPHALSTFIIISCAH
jgi:hypothetical protein